MNILASLAVSIQLFAVTHHDGGMAQAVSPVGVQYQLDSHYQVGDTVLTIYRNDDIITEMKLDLYSIRGGK